MTDLIRFARAELRTRQGRREAGRAFYAAIATCLLAIVLVLGIVGLTP